MIPFLSSAQSSTDTANSALLDTLLKKIPFESRLQRAPKDIEMQFAQNPLGLPAEKNEKMIALFAEGFVIDSLMYDVKKVFEERYQNPYSDEFQQWLSRPSTQKVHEAEEATNTLQGARRRVVRMYELEQEPPSEEREEVILSLMNSTSTVDNAIQSQTILFRSIVSAFSILSDQRTFSDSQIDGIVSNYRMEIENQIQDDLKQQYLIMYFDLDSEALREYTSFYESDAGSWLDSTATEAVTTAYQNATDRFIEAIENIQ
ncbi:hypothetical protein G3570_04390 [Balneolaceae bacterium YR4-1]|uniref:DUF2059 domain-containing protein n=1 Tax=Halalkalibaculum roseum TaxID=2709311 RepID=A0A6M1SLI2_9BACT|nr:hypothetical protein [Halalkalibaculum roseum]